MAANFSLLLSDARLTDQRTFTCMVVAGANIVEYPVNIVVYSEYKLPCGKRIFYWNTALITFFLSSFAETPTELKISDKAEELEIGKPTKVGVFNAKHCYYLLNFRHL